MIVSADERPAWRTLLPTSSVIAQFLVRPGHEVPGVEIVVTSTPLYLVVEKTGEAAEYVAEHLEG
jgi:hypothetical protein